MPFSYFGISFRGWRNVSQLGIAAIQVRTSESPEADAAFELTYCQTLGIFDERRSLWVQHAVDTPKSVISNFDRSRLIADVKEGRRSSFREQVCKKGKPRNVGLR